MPGCAASITRYCGRAARRAGGPGAGGGQESALRALCWLIRAIAWLLLLAALERHVSPFLWDPVMTTILEAPAWLAFVLPGIALLALGSLCGRARSKGMFRS